MVHGMCQGCAARRRLSRPRVRGTQAL